MKRIPELEALRGLLALWVALGHVLRHTGYVDGELGPFALLGNPGLAVDVFIMLSGFVIFGLLDRQGQGYAPFIVARFFRLFPLYLVLLAVSAVSQPFQAANIAAMPWRSVHIESDIAIHAAAIGFLPEQLAAHLTMLHGLLPERVLPFSDYALLGQAWSISVEWQFYLVAPLLFAFAFKRPLTLAAILLAIAAARGRGWLGEGFAINQAGYFLIGTLSNFLWRRLRGVSDLDRRRIWLAAAAAVAVIYCLLPRAVSSIVWALTLAVATEAACTPGGAATLPARLLRSAPLQWLGRISYSLYLTHMLVFYSLSGLLLALAPHLLQSGRAVFLAVVMPLTIALALALSTATHRLIEQPGIDLGHRAARALRERQGA